MADELMTYGLDEPFPGKLGKTIDDSTEAWPMPIQAPDGAPNVLFYVLDDVGFGQLSPYGGLVEAPNLQRVADAGVTYTNFHTTGLCSPTRTCIITGRNHHSNAMGSISEWSTGYPGYDGRMLPHHGFISEILTEEGYNTFGLGKWHLSVSTEETMAGPFDTWPMRRGFDRYYGFLPGETDQWYPDLVYDNHFVSPPAGPEDGYHLSKDLADKALEFIGDAHMISPDKPFFMYFCPGAGHAPHHIFKEEADKYKGKFDMGWDQYREVVFASQKKLGMFPEDTVISPRDPDVPEWDSLSDDEKKLYTRMMEVFAGFVSYTDEQFGRILDFLESLGELDNTLILFISDNGASPEGGAVGSLNEYDFFNFKPEDLENNLKHIDELGTPNSYNHYAWGWAHAGNTPFRRWKKETFRGATTDPFIISWPAKFTAKGEMRHQYGHAIDMVPTVLDLLGIDPPDSIKGVKQSPHEGVSLKSTIDDAHAKQEHTVQYFEMFGCRSIYKDGWRAECGWPGPDYATGKQRGHEVGDPIHARDLEDLEKTWQLFNLKDDPAESNDVAAEHPERLRELEPHSAGIQALHVPSAGIIDFQAVAAKLAGELESLSCEVRTGTRVTGIRHEPDGMILDTDRGALRTKYMIGCAGLHSDRVTRMEGAPLDLSIVPFRGEYYELSARGRELVRGLIYPVPDPRFPFLGVHFTKRIDGSVEAGPNAVLALSREGYRKLQVRLRDVADIATFPGFWRMAAKYWRTALEEMARSLSKKAFANALMRLVPDIRSDDLAAGGSGIRAQALRPSGELVDDFVIVDRPRALHVCNAPSPAATASLSIAIEIVNRATASFELGRRVEYADRNDWL